MRRVLIALPLVWGLFELQAQKISWTDREKPIADRIHALRSLSDQERPAATKDLALQIRDLPAGSNRLVLAESLAGLATEGDPGAVTLQAVANTLAETLAGAATPAAEAGYGMLATLAHYENVPVKISDPRFQEALAKLKADDQAREQADFTLTDLTGKQWTLKGLRGKVVLVNFWATWCPPCRKEMPDLDSLYRRFEPKGLVILAISDEEAAKVQPFLAEHPVSYPILLDPGRKVNDLFHVEGIPKSFVYDRTGKLAAQAIDMRTEGQFLAMLARAGMD